MKRHGHRLVVLAAALLLALLLVTGCSGSESSSDGAPCANNTDCTFGYRCLNTTCVTLRCTHPRDCLTGEFCKFDSGKDEGVCTVRPDTEPDPTDGDELDGDTPDEPAGVCLLNERRCRGNILESCVNFNSFLDWRFEADCAHGCTLGACVEPPAEDGDEEEEICVPGNMQCFSNQVQRCSTDGMEWELVDACLLGTCVEETSGGTTIASCGPRLICQPGMRVCDDEGSAQAVKVCNETGTDWRVIYCANHEACINGICQSTTACTRGRYRCNGNTVEVCRDNGSGWDRVRTCTDGEETCACGTYSGSECVQASCIKNAVCTPLLDTRCSGNVVQRCDSSGTGWAFWSDCSTQDPPKTCVNGSCQ